MNGATTSTHIMPWSGERSWKTYPYTTLSISISTCFYGNTHTYFLHICWGLSVLWNERTGLHSCYELMLAFSEMRYGKILWNISNTNIFPCDFPPQSIFHNNPPQPNNVWFHSKLRKLLCTFQILLQELIIFRWVALSPGTGNGNSYREGLGWMWLLWGWLW